MREAWHPLKAEPVNQASEGSQVSPQLRWHRDGDRGYGLLSCASRASCAFTQLCPGLATGVAEAGLGALEAAGTGWDIRARHASVCTQGPPSGSPPARS